ncbi:hydantoinase b/oxoprolinase domain-containing protein [Ditylenchus destructor]|uniref:Hydantoinase b/oxoprolinase domain-containing protein n=1 Tax=Ditylenchus destructor TaxID=166010 RepID=A0AAD4NGB9_9BILA|nr:hydantoinase b/oxoprolinase domain-containing protein [Ditylenchus destructor]
MSSGLGFGIDRGGTFTDVFVVYPDGSNKTFKLLSEDKTNYADAPTEAIRRILNEYTGTEVKRGEKIPTENISWIRMGTTVATNALLERRGEPTALLITKGFKDLLYIGNQSRPKIFDFDIKIPDPLYEKVFEVDERVLLEDETCQMNIEGEKVVTANGKTVIIEKPISEQEITLLLKEVRAANINSLAVLFLHSYIFPDHEKLVEKIARSQGFENISISSGVIPMIKAVPRGFTTCADAYLTPIIQTYIQGFRAGFMNNLKGVELEFMQSDGGLCPVEGFIGSRAILSGPAGGVVGVSYTAYDKESKEPIIGFDMGGTSTDVSRYAGQFDHVLESITAGVTIQAPQLEINTVAAGGGSRLFFKTGLFVVGPESAGSTPGPVCYRKNGFLTVTDANLVLGRIIPEYFPHIFGKSEAMPLDKDASLQAFERITEEINTFLESEGRSKITVPQVALGFIQVANESMCRPIRTLTEAKGYDTSAHVLACFGGAGGQHACAVARTLGMRKVKVHKYAGILSAYGLALANVVNEKQEAYIKPLTKETFGDIGKRFEVLEKTSGDSLLKQNFTKEDISFERILHMRYEKTDCVLMCVGNNKTTLDGFIEIFLESYKREFGFTISDRDIIVDDIRVRGIARRYLLKNKAKLDETNAIPKEKNVVKCWFDEGELDTKVFDYADLIPGHKIGGPAIIIDKNCTIIVEPDCEAKIALDGTVEITLLNVGKSKIGEDVDPIQLSIFSHRFMSIAEQMGSVLQRSAISTNIKERLDFSCALFGPDGGLVANAPHIPVHLGGMQATVTFQIDHLGKDGINRGDVILCNHPKAGGSHLPDLTIITPVYFSDSEIPDFYVANRGHHSDIGGLVPGSMPPHSTSLDQEGAAFISFKIVENGTFKEKELIEALNAPGKVPGCSGTRNLMKAYMSHIQSNAEQSVRKLLKETAERSHREKGSRILKAVDYMDDGTAIQLAVEIDDEKGEAIFDFTGTGIQVYSSSNSPPAVLMAAVIYSLRCLVGHDIPLNQGCLIPVKIVVPDGTIISPDDKAAVVGGNVLTSQRLCDVIFRAFECVAASQGCMNNITFGDDQFGYYETVAGGAGAGAGFNGRSGVHTHMTNTRITDPEIVESRYPVIVRKFCLRPNSGGRGEHRGGDGVSRYLQFRRPLQLSVLTERRVHSPYGLFGGENGERGLNILNRKVRGRVNLGSKNSICVQPGDIFELETPGGGGYGSPKN